MTTKVTGRGGVTDSSGRYRVAEGPWAVAEGYLTKATQMASHAEGYSAQATGVTSHAEGYSTTASNSYSHAEGKSTSATGANSHAEGEYSTSYGTNSHAEGYNGNAVGVGSHVEGYSCQTLANYSHAEGHYASPFVIGQSAIGAGRFSMAGDAQATTLALRALTTDGTATTLTSDGGPVVTADLTANVLRTLANRAHTFTINVVARRNDVSGDAAGWQFTGLVVRGASGSAAFAGAVATATWCTAGAGTWDVTPSIDTTSAPYNYLKLTATGLAAQTIRWVARIDTAEVG